MGLIHFQIHSDIPNKDWTTSLCSLKSFVYILRLLQDQTVDLFDLLPIQTIHEDIQAHQNPVLQTLQDAQQLIRQHSLTLPSDEQTKLTEKLSELRNRFDAINTESNARTIKIKFAAEDLPKLEEELGDFQTWLEGAEKSMDDLLRTRSSEALALRKQYNAVRNFTEDVISHAADLKFVVKGGQKYLDSAKVRFGKCVLWVSLWPDQRRNISFV